MILLHNVYAGYGNKYKYDGTLLEDEKYRSKFYMPLVSKIDLNTCTLLNSTYKNG